MFLIKFILFIFIFFLVIILFIAYSFYKQITRVRRRFRPEDVEERGSGNTNTIIDHRPKNKSPKQVISDDEGEYVDFIDSDPINKD